MKKFILPIFIFLITSGYSKPNIIMLLVDDLGYGDLSSFGAPDLQSPNIDGLITSGMRFNQFYANSNVCTPSRGSLLTGRYPDMVGTEGVIRTDPPHTNWGFFNPGAITLPQALKTAGYHTAIVGKWHLGLDSPTLPNERGFDHFHGFLGDMMDDYYTHRRAGQNYMRLNDQVIDPTGHATDIFTQWAIDYINDRINKPEPFFLYLAYNAPHTPVQPPQSYLDRVNQREPGIGATRARLVAFIEHLDDGIGMVMDSLKASGMEDNTIVIYSSDNGGQGNAGARNAPLRGAKQDMWEGGIRVATGFKWPGVIPAGTSTDRVAALMDVYPTLCEITGATCNHDMDGRSLYPTLMGHNQPEEDRYLFWMRLGDRGNQNGEFEYFAARYGDNKILENRPTDPMRLYNLANDPGEQNDLGQNNAVYRNLDSALTAHRALADTVGWQIGSDAIVPATITLLEPNDGTFYGGQGNIITWESNLDLGSVKIEYAESDFLWKTIADTVPSSVTGSYTWNMDFNLPYQVGFANIRVSGLNGNVRDISDTTIKFISVHPVKMKSYFDKEYQFSFSESPNILISKGNYSYVQIFNSNGILIDRIKIQDNYIQWKPDKNSKPSFNGLYLIKFQGPSESNVFKYLAF